MAGRTTAVGVLIGMILVIAIGGLVFGHVIDTIDDQRPGQSADFNTTMDLVIAFGWLAFTFFGLGVLVFAAKWILNMVRGF